MDTEALPLRSLLQPPWGSHTCSIFPSDQLFNTWFDTKMQCLFAKTCGCPCSHVQRCSISQAEQATPASAGFLAAHSSWVWILDNLLSLCLALMQPLRHVPKLQGCRGIPQQWWEGGLGTVAGQKTYKRHTGAFMLHADLQNPSFSAPQLILITRHNGWCLCCHHHIMALRKKTSEILSSGKVCATRYL